MDKATERKVRSFIIKCPRGCQWTGELRSKEVGVRANCNLAFMMIGLAATIGSTISVTSPQIYACFNMTASLPLRVARPLERKELYRLSEKLKCRGFIVNIFSSDLPGEVKINTSIWKKIAIPCFWRPQITMPQDDFLTAFVEKRGLVHYNGNFLPYSLRTVFEVP